MTKHPLSDLDGEIRDHIERETDDNIARGMSARDARYAALRKFGSVARAREDARDVWIPVWLDQLRQDARYALRMLGRNPGFTTVAVLTLALGIGLTTAVFSVVHAVLLRPLPYADGDRIVLVRETFRQVGNASAGHFHDWTEHSTVFEHTAAGQGTTFNLAGEGDPERVRGMRVTPGYFEVALHAAGGRPLLHAARRRVRRTRRRLESLAVAITLRRRPRHRRTADPVWAARPSPSLASPRQPTR